MNINEQANFIWSIADLLRGDFKQSEYGKVILPFTVLRRFDCVLAPSKAKILEANKTLTVSNKRPIFKRMTGHDYYNVSQFDFEKLMDDSNATLSGITAQDLQEYYNTKLDEGLSVCTMKKHSAILHGALAEAYKKDMIAANPADKVTLPRKKKFYGQSYSVEEVQQLLSVLNDDPIRPAVILAVMYGLRRSEAVGLRWKDIDFKNKTMTICNTVTRMATVHELEETKNESSHRTLPLIPGTEEYLQSLRREQKETMLLCGNRFDDSCHVCTWPDGRSLQPDYVSQHFNQVLKKNNFRVIRYHDLRHTAGSMLLQKGIDIKTIQHFLGHSQASTTVNIYLHSISNGTVDAANAIGSMVNVGTVC